MKYTSANIFEDFEFHDAWLKLERFDAKHLHLSAQHLNIHKAAEQNEHGCDMELDTAMIALSGICVTSYTFGGGRFLNEKGEVIATEPQTVLTGAAAEERLIDELRSGVRVYEFGVHGDSGCYLDGSGAEPWFHARFSFDTATIQWDGYQNAAWYEKRP